MIRANKIVSVSKVDKVTNVMMLKGLSKNGQIFWNFMCDKQETLGNHPRELLRSSLIQLYRDDLNQEKLADERFMEIDHGFIQWLFPLETIGVNPEAPVITKNDYRILRNIDDFKLKMVEHFLLFTEFMGLKYNQGKGLFEKVNSKQWESWIEHPHNNLRISRILTSMKDFGLEKIARDFLEFLQIESRRTDDEVIDKQVFRKFAGVTRKSCDNFWTRCL